MKDEELNKTVVFIAVSVIVLITVIGAILLAVLRPDASATLISQVSILLGLLVTTVVAILNGIKLERKIEEVREQTNGNLTRRDDEIAELRAFKERTLREADAEVTE